MKISTLISGRPELLRQAHLANLALAHETLRNFARRIERARLTGRVVLQPTDPDSGRYCATLTALDGRQSVIEEHFTDEDFLELADVLGFALGQVTGDPRDISFRLEKFTASFLAPLRAELEKAGVAIDEHTLPSDPDRPDL